MEFTSANVEKVVLQFYQQSGTNQQQNHEWLTRAQMSPQAWEFAWDLVTPQKNPEVQFFGANTLATKVSKFFHEVPVAQFTMLRERLLTLLTTYSLGPKMVTTRLCVAVAGLVNHALPKLWATPIQDLVAIFQREMESKGVGVLLILLEMLTVIPEEFLTMIMNSGRRNEVRVQLANTVPSVLDLIKKVFTEAGIPNDITVQSIKALQSWVQFGVPMEEEEGLFGKLLVCMKDEEMFECSLEAMCSIVSHPNTHKFPNTMKKLLGHVLSLDQVLFKLMQEDSYEVALPLATLFITFGESHSRLLLDWTTESEEGRNAALRLVSIILRISSSQAQFPTQETLSEIAFGFWYIFQDDIIACEPQQFQHCITVFGRIYHELVESLLRKSMYPLNDQSWTADQKEVFRCYRTDVADTIMYCFNILRDNLLQILLSHLDQAITKSNNEGQQHWPYLEACLYAWSAIGESMAEEEESALLSQFLAKLPLIPYNNNPKVISSALDCIGGFAEWLANYPQLVPHVIPIVTSALPNQELSLCATMALKDMARDCTDGLKPYAKEVVSACVSALRSNQLKPGECVRLMYPIGKMLSMMPQEEIMGTMESILTPYITELRSLSAQEPNVQLKTRVVFILKLLTTLFQALNLNPKEEGDKVESQQNPKRIQPMITLFPQLFPLVKDVAARWVRDEEVMDTVWGFLKQCAHTLLNDIRPFTQDILELLINCYTTAPHGAALELAKLFLTLLGSEPGYAQAFVQLFARINTTTMQFIQSTGNVSDHSDLIATYFQVMSQIMKKDRKMFDPQGIEAGPLFQCATFCLALPESSVVRYASSFISHMVTVSRESPYLTGIVNEQGEMLFKQVVTCIGGDYGKNHGDYYAEILLSLNKKYFDNLCNYMNILLREENFPTERVSRQQKEQFAQMVLKERANKRKLIEIVREFSLACNGMISTEQMNQVLAAYERIEEKHEVAAELKQANAAAAAAGGVMGAGVLR
ncbi:hypothetical protein TCAL_07050 [Tigriopus californicus]|uniref:Importin-13 n=1 Tax=Tigriopus californicus TaxID=6832 RepID=A0A553PNZ8_TIGCA|nr:importin-13-like [Tigriopus californicus]TRY79407.1 hypothetical protein TCAL_07050 [Tigriopus californicus]|eukprot:TCALIF_07050-PA protein Name:"Similar to IPO13 Importin-13 (Homo sapiens)" AED:0.03 eAED:0.03 QI:0/-1/0/1/-1/1/1/0/985